MSKIKIFFITFLILFFVIFENKTTNSLTTCSHTEASNPSLIPSDIDLDGLIDEYCFKDSGLCPCPVVNRTCYGCWRDLKPPKIENLEICYLFNNNKICQKLNYRNPVFVIEYIDNNLINISWQTDEDAKCFLIYLYDNIGNKTNISLTNPEVNVIAVPNTNLGSYSTNFLVQLNLTNPVRLRISCFDRDTLEGPNYPPNVELDLTCDILNDTTRIDTCKYKGSIGPIIILNKDPFNFLNFQIRDPDNIKIKDITIFYQARKIERVNIILFNYIFQLIKEDKFCKKEGNYSLSVYLYEISNNITHAYNYSWFVNWDNEKFCKEECTQKEVSYNITNSLNSCCGDDLNEYPKKRICIDVCETNENDLACCLNKNYCVYNFTCYSNSTMLDIDKDGFLELCENGVWISPKGIGINQAKLLNSKAKIDDKISLYLNITVENGNFIRQIIYQLKNLEVKKINEEIKKSIINENKSLDILIGNFELKYNIIKSKGIKEFLLQVDNKLIKNDVFKIEAINENYLTKKIFEDLNTFFVIISSNEIKNLEKFNVSIKEILFLPINFTTKQVKYPKNFYSAYMEFYSDSIEVSSNSHKNYKIICKENNKILPFRLENKVVTVLDPCTTKILLSKIPEKNLYKKVTFNPNLYLKFS